MNYTIYGNSDTLAKACLEKRSECYKPEFIVTTTEVDFIEDVLPKKKIPAFYKCDSIKTPTIGIGSIKYFLTELKGFYIEGYNHEETFEKFKKKMGPDYDEILIESILTQYLIEKEISPKYTTEKNLQPVIALKDITSDEEIRHMCSLNGMDTIRYLMKSGIEPSRENLESIDTLAAFFEMRKPKSITPIVPDTIDNVLGKKLNHNPRESELFTAAIYHSNVLAEYTQKQKKQEECSSYVEIDNSKEHNNLADVAMLTGIKPSRIRSFTRRLEDDSDVKAFRIEQYGHNLRDLDKDTRISIYEDMQKISVEDAVIKYNLKDNGVAKRAYRSGERHIINPKI
jgi:hypothetical protein